MSLSLIRKTQWRFGDIHSHSQCNGQAEDDADHQPQERSTQLFVCGFHVFMCKINKVRGQVKITTENN